MANQDALQNSERGAALILALIGLMLLTLLGLAAALSSSIEYNISNHYVTSQQALAIADSGLNFGKSYLRGRDFSGVLKQYALVPAYTSETQPAEEALAARNPITSLAARSIDFSIPFSTPVTPWKVYGFIGPTSGAPLGGGRYFLKLTDNKDETETNDPYADIDHKSYLRSIGIYRTLTSDKVSPGRVQASVAVIEVLLKRDLSFEIASPFALYGPDVNPAQNNLFDGNSFLIDGYNHNGMTRDQILGGDDHPETGAVSGVGSIFNGGDGDTVSTIEQSLAKNQENNITGAGGTPSVGDITDTVKNGVDSANVLDPNFVGKFISTIKNYADISYAGNTALSGNNIVLGTASEPKVTVVNGNLSLSGSGSGAGILIVTGEFDFSGSFDYEGVILVIGLGKLTLSGANKSIIGGLYLANVTKDGSGKYSYGTPSFSLGGNSNFYYKSDSIKMGLNLLPLKILSWREVPSELDETLVQFP
ncbi:MAG: hypothetical protein HY644_03970 [Acidobacteria bacterium]|nr:hypothetical protein [Acidobacteriota bacterium]